MIVMKRWSPRRVLTLLVAVSLFMGASLQSVWSADMSVRVLNLGSQTQDMCLGCKAKDDQTEQTSACIALCTVLSHQLALAPGLVEPVTEKTPYPTVAVAFRTRTVSPERSPPRPIELG